MLEIFQGQPEILRPCGGATTDGDGLRGLVVRGAERWQILPLLCKVTERQQDASRFCRDKFNRLTQQDQFGIAVDELTGGTEVDDALGLRDLVTPGVDVRHDIVSQLPLIVASRLKIKIIQMRPHGFKLSLADVQTEFMLRFGQSQPQPSPCAEFPLVRPDLLHRCRGIAGRQRRAVG